MSQHDYDIANQGFPAFRTDLNNVLGAINSSNSGTSRPSSAVQGTIWIDTTNSGSNSLTLKFYDGSDDISFADIDTSANTVNWLDSSVSFDIVSDLSPQLGADLDINGNSIVSVSNGNISITPDGSGKVILDGLSHPTADGTNGQALVTDGAGNLSFGDVSVSLSAVGESIIPSTTDTYDLGATSFVWRNIYTGDLHLSNEAKEEGNSVDGTKGNWTIQEGSEDLFIVNNKSGKKYKFKLEEI